MNKVKVLVVDDSAFMRRILKDMLHTDFRIEVVGTARNGKDCLDQLPKLEPDVVTMDVEMPILNGLDTLKEIMATRPVPVVMVSSLTKEGTDTTIQAMANGAVDFIAKPSGSISLDMARETAQVVQKVLSASRANVQRGRLMERKPPLTFVPHVHTSKKNLVAIGTSTGGPRALDQVIRQLPRSFQAPIVIVQHMPKGFTRSLAERLNKISEVTVKEAEHGEPLQPGTAYIAPGGQHMKIIEKGRRLHVELDTTEPVFGHRPSVNRMFESVSLLPQVEPLAIIMTGMGADGTEGLVKMKEHSRVYAIAESEETCVVFGMPKAAIKSGLVDEIVPLQQISQRIVQIVGQ